MPEGPSILILRESLEAFKGKKVLSVSGNAKTDLEKARGQKVNDFKSFGKQFLICFDDFFIRIHLLMFGSYRINEKKDSPPRLNLVFKNGELNFYNCSVKVIGGNVDELYDWRKDVLSDNWDPKLAEKTIKKLKSDLVCDVLLNQDIFAGVGNIIKNEVLFRIRVHPASVIPELPPKKLKELVREARQYSWDFYHWKKDFVLRAHWLIYKKGQCPRCKIKSTNTYLGKTNRLTSYCGNCQILYE